jgi:uncharacterized membrane protein SpoIIM required for sporulation
MKDRISRASLFVILASVAAGVTFGWVSEPSTASLSPLDFAQQLQRDGLLAASRFDFLKYILWNNLVALVILYLSAATTAGGMVPVLFFIHATTIGHLARALSVKPDGVLITLLLTAPHGLLELTGFVVIASSILSVVLKFGLRVTLNRKPESGSVLMSGTLKANGAGIGLLVIAAFVEAFVTPDLCLWIIELFRLG